MDLLISQITDWDELANTAINRGMGPLLHKKLHLVSNNSLIPANIQQKLKSSYFHTLNRNMLLYHAFSELATVLTSGGIQVVALKGIYLSEWLYRDIGLRQLSDIDILIKQEDGEKSIEILEKIGYQGTKNEFSEHLHPEKEFIHYPPMIKNGVSVEVHIRLHKKSPKYNINIEQFIKNSIPVKVNNVQVHVPEFYDQLIFLCVHSDKHFTGSKIQFTCFIDLTNILVEHAGSMNWATLTEQSKINGCEKVVFKHLLLVNEFFEAPVPGEVVEKYRNCLTEEDKEMFIRYLNGYFNVKNHIESFSTNVIQIKGVGNKIGFVFRNIFPSKKFMVDRYKIKHSSFYWMYYPYRYWLVINSLLGRILKRNSWLKD